jgi:UDP-glucose 4-epimerase
MRDILITGAGGQLGRALVPLVRRVWPDARLTLVTRRSIDASNVVVVAADLRTGEGWRSLGDHFDLVFHLAAVIPEGKDNLACYDANASMARRLCAAAPNWGVRQIVFSSSISVYAWDGRPLRETTAVAPASYYAAGKLAGEGLLAVLAAGGLRAASLRLSSLYGPGRRPRPDGTVLYRFLHLAQAGRELPLFGRGARTQDFIHEADAAALLVRAVQAGASGVFNAGSGRAVSMLTLARAACCVAGRSPELIRFVPERPEGASVRVDMRRTRTVLGWAPRVGLREGLADVLP